MKLCILGGGGFRTPYVYQALLRDHGSPRIDEVVLQDVDSDRLQSMAGLLRQLADSFPDAPRIVETTDLDAALDGSDFVFTAVRVGGLGARCCDERVALDLGVLGQETTGPGGLAFALRTLPFMLHVAARLKVLAPDAWLLNFTNPAGIVTEAVQTVLGDRALGICDTPSGLGRRVAGRLGLDPTSVQLDYVGLNHLGWMRRVLSDGVDVLPQLLADDAALSGMEEGIVFGAEWLRDLGSIPNEYLYYYYFQREAVRSILDAQHTRGEFLLQTQRDFYQRVRGAGAGAVDLWRDTVTRRSASYMAEAKGGEQGSPAWTKEPETDPAHQGYAGVALAVMSAISRNERSTLILNVRNGNTLPGLPADAVIEVPCLVDGDGVHPLATESPDLHQLGLMQQVKAVERLTIDAAVSGDEGSAVKAFALHPLVDSVTTARKLLAGYIERIPEVARVFGR